MRFRKRIMALASIGAMALGLTVATSTAAFAATCTTNALNGTCGPYAYPGIPMSNGFDTYVVNQSVNPQAGTVNSLTVTDPGNWNAVAHEADCGGCVQTYINSNQLTNDWNPATQTWGSGSSDTPLSALSALTIHYTESSSNTAANYEFSPDIWNDVYPNDAMLWADTSHSRCVGNGLSSTDIIGQATLTGQNWTVYRLGGVGGEIIMILDGTTSTDPVTTGTCAQQTTGNLDVLGAEQWLFNHGIMSSLGTLSQLNTGWEMCGGDATLTMSSYSMTATVSGQAQAPAVVTNPATNVTSTGVTLNGTVNPEGQATTYQYQYGTTTAYGTNIPATAASAGSGTTAVSEPQSVTGLTPNTLYHYRLTASNATGTTNGADQTFTTNATASAPAVTTNPATNITSSGATLNGSVNPNGQATTYQFQYGTTTSYGTNVPATAASAGSGTTAVSESAALTGLAASTVYHYRITATNATGTSNGSDQTFTTTAATSPILGDTTVEASADSNVQGQAQAVQYTASRTGTSQTISFYVDPSSTATSAAIGEYSNSGTDPGTLLKQVTFTPKSGWNTITFTGVSEVSGTKYWLAELGVNGTLVFRDQGAGAYSPGSSSATLTSLPATWVTGPAWHSGLMSEYVSGL